MRTATLTMALLALAVGCSPPQHFRPPEVLAPDRAPRAGKAGGRRRVGIVPRPAAARIADGGEAGRPDRDHYAVERKVAADGLAVTVSTNQPHVRHGETFVLHVVVENTAPRPIHIRPDNDAPLILRMWRFDGVSWDIYMVLPRCTMQAIQEWDLAPGSENAKRWSLDVPVDVDWLTHEALRITAEPNGRADAAAGVTVIARPGAAQGK